VTPITSYDPTMLTRTIEHAVNNTFGPRADAAADQFTAAIDRAEHHVTQARQEIIDRIELGTYVISGAIVLGFIIAGLLARAGN
jgi:hypothetical protein